MKSMEKLYDSAIGNYGIVTSAEAKTFGVSNMALVQLAKRGRLIHLRRGVYRLAQYVPTEYDDYAQAVISVGEGAYLYGESVVALLKLTPTNPSFIYVATPMRSRKRLPDSIVLRPAPKGYHHVSIQGIPCQRVSDAIRAARTTVDPDRLVEAAREAYRMGFIKKEEVDALLREMEFAK
jgi:predicted transcriptional regulator of viral defense system